MVIDTRAVMRSLPLVASVLGRQYGVKVETGGTDAYTDGTVIRLPSLPGDVPDTFLSMDRGFLDHEARHFYRVAIEIFLFLKRIQLLFLQG